MTTSIPISSIENCSVNKAIYKSHMWLHIALSLRWQVFWLFPSRPVQQPWIHLQYTVVSSLWKTNMHEWEKTVALIFNSNTDQLLVKTHETKFLSPLELLDQLRITQFSNLMVPNSEGKRFKKPVHNRHHISPRTIHQLTIQHLPIPSRLVVFNENSLTANRDRHHNTVNNLSLGVIRNFMEEKEGKTMWKYRVEHTQRHTAYLLQGGEWQHLPKCNHRYKDIETSYDCKKQLE